jgi:type VI secretion system secreted protein VgrG
MSHADLITITSSVLPDDTRVAAFRGTEAFSKPYELEIFLLLDDEELDLADCVGAKACLTIDRAQDSLPPYHFSGVLAVVELLHEIDGRSLVRAVLVPRLWLLGLSRHSRIFTKMSILDVIKAVLEDNAISGSDYEFRVGSRPPEEHVCQYRESDLAFISRWMEREGIYYYFEHTEDGEKLILGDSTGYDEDPGGTPIRYYPQTGADGSAGVSFRSFKCRHATLPTLVKLRDYDYAKPNLEVSGSAKVSDDGAGEVFLYGERFFSPDDGERLAKLRAEEMLARQVVYFAKGTPFHIRPGYTFELEDHPRDAFNTKYLTIEARHFGNQAAQNPLLADLDLPSKETYNVELLAIPATTQFRPESVTRWPRIYGYENGVVDGPAESEYAQIDDQGRYSVKFKFDESDLKNGGASTFVRMMQPHGGGIEGFHFPLRKATEVVISFLGGDPDRPVISGVVPNALTPSPVTSGNHTRNVLQTGGRNRFELEDKAGQQRVTLSTPYSNTYIRMGSPNDGHELIVQTDDNTFLNAGKNLFIDAGIMNGGFCQVRVKGEYKSFVEEGPYSLIVRNNTWLTRVKGDTYFHVTDGYHHTDVDTGDFKMNVPANSMTTTTKGDYTVNVTTNNTKFDTKGTTEIKSKGKVTVNSTDSPMDLLAKGDINMTSSNGNIKIDAPTGKIDLHATGEIKMDGASKWYQYSAGDFFKFNFSMGVALTVGMTSETKIGIFNENMIGGKLETALAVKIEMCTGLTVKIGAGPAEIKMSNAKLDQVAVKMKSILGPCVTSAVARVSRGSLHCYLP